MGWTSGGVVARDFVNGYSKTFPRDFLTFLDCFSGYSLEHAAASVGNKELDVSNYPYSRLMYMMDGF